MSDIETRTRNLALALIRGDSKTSLTEVEQRRLAAWSFLKVISLELGRPLEEPRTFPDAMYSGFRRFQHPPLSNCVILPGRRMSPREGEPYIWHNSQGQRHRLPGAGEALGYRTALAIGHLIVDVLGLFIEGTIHVEDEDPRLVRIWPPVLPSVRLPPERFEAAEQLGGLPYRE